MKEKKDKANALEVISYLFSIRLLLEKANISVRYKEQRLVLLSLRFFLCIYFSGFAFRHFHPVR